MSSDCIFCKVVAGELPSTEVLSSEQTYAFRDINPGAPTHILVVPKEHVADNAAGLGSEHGELLAEMIDTAQRVATAEGVAESGFRLVFNVGPDALNSVPHLHLHVLGGRQLGAMG
jgi:histidine triad (HIT) family protein